MNITPEQLSKATDEEFSELAGEVLQLSNKHQLVPFRAEKKWYCKKCEVSIPYYEDLDGTCEIPHADPIPLTWTDAMKWRDWAVEKFGDGFFEASLIEVIGNAGIYSSQGALCYGEPRHYIEAACLCVINAKEGK